MTLNPTPLKLIAQDEEDLRIFSAHLQDAVLRIGDMAYLPQQRRFAAVLCRYRWEDGSTARHGGLRMRTGLHFDSVLAVKTRGINRTDAGAALELLAIRFEEGDDGAGTVELCFAGTASLRLDVECVAASLRDMEGPWLATARPAHDLGQDLKEV